MKKNTSIYDPIREQFLILVEYMNILDQKNKDTFEEICLLIDLLNNIHHQCSLYLNYELRKHGENING